jgi:cell wall-associated NlpC family hydrolase
MQLGRHSIDIGSRRGRVRAAAFRAAWSRPGSLRRVLVLGLICGLLAAGIAASSVAFAAPSAKTQIKSLEKQAEELKAQIADLDVQLEASTEAYNALAVQMDEINVNMTVLRDRQDAAQRDYQYRLQLYEERLCELYKAGGQDEFLQIIFDATDVDDFVSRARFAAALADQDRRLMDSLTRASKQLETVLAQLDTAKSEQLVVRNQMDEEKERIDSTLATRQSTLANVDAQIAAIIEAEKQREAEEQARLQAALSAILNGGQVYNGVLPQTDSELLNQFLQTAAAYVGVPYVWGGDRPSNGLDCSGYTAFVYKQHGVSLPHYSGYQAALGIPVDLANIQPGDLLAFGFPVHHVGIYIGDDLFLHAAGTGLDVRVGRLSSRSDLAAIRRFDLKARTGAPDMY